jgi:exodeoxyribonuclease VII large subunit
VLKGNIDQQQQFFVQTQMHIKHTLRTWVTKRTHLLNRQKIRLTSARRLQIMFQKNKLDLLAKNIETHSPAFLLKHGYTITTINGKRIHSVAQLKTGEKIRTFVHDGSFESEITSKD